MPYASCKARRLFRATRQVVAYAVGDCSRATCRKLWAAIPQAHSRGHCFDDFREACRLVIPAEQHTAACKESGLTAHVERWKQHAAPAPRALRQEEPVISESDMTRELCLRLLPHDYNKSVALSCD